MSQTEVQLIKNGAVVDADINGMSSSKLSGALPAISGASLTNLPTPTGKTRNLIINGAMQVAQRGTSDTATGNGYPTVDRIVYYNQGIDNDVTKAQVDVAAGTTPYTSGFRKAFKLTNGNQSSGAGAADIIEFGHKIEAQDIANSGWNYTDPNSKITLSFWVKSSVAQNFNFFLVTSDGTAQNYPYETGSLSADTWTKITKTIPGNSNLQFDNNNEQGLSIMFPIFYGTNFTGSRTLDQWSAHSGSARTPDQTSTWYTTNDATFEITGLQLEVNSVATDFEHRSFGQELALCQRYFQHFGKDTDINFTTYTDNNFNPRLPFSFPKMRAAPTATISQSGNINGTISFSTINTNCLSINIARSSGAGIQDAQFDFTLSSEL